VVVGGIEAVDLEQPGQGAGGRRGGVDDGHVRPDDLGDDGREQRVVGATQEEGVDALVGRQREDVLAVAGPVAQQGRQGRGHLGLDVVAGEPPGLDHGHEGRRRVLVDLDERVLVLDGLEVGMRADGGLGGDDADTAGPRGQRSGRGARPDDAHDGHVVPGTHRRQGHGRGRVAGDDDRLDVTRREHVEALQAEAHDFVVGPWPVRRPRVVAEVDGRLAGRAAEDLAQDGQATDTRVEESDRARIRHRPQRLRAAATGSAWAVRLRTPAAILAMSALMRAAGSASTKGTPWLFDSTTSRPSEMSENSGSRPRASASAAGPMPPVESARLSR
jgi:hypothetical protein